MWPTFLPQTFELIKNPDAKARECALVLFGSLVTIDAEALKGYYPVMSEQFLACLTDTVPTVRMAALNATATFLQTIDVSKEEITAFQDLTPGLMKCLEMVEDEDASQSALEALIELVESNYRFYRKHIGSVIQGMLSIAQHVELEDRTRNLATEFLLTMCESGPGLMRKVPNFLDAFVPVLLLMILSIEDDEEWGSRTDDADQRGDTSVVSMAEGAFDRLALSLGGNMVLPAVWPHVQECLGRDDWKARYTGITVITHIAEGCQKLMETNIGQLLDIVCKVAASDQHPRCRWVAINCLGQLCDDFSPDVQEDHHALVLPTLMNAIRDNAAHPRVQAHAATATVNFTGPASDSVLEPYLDQLLSQLFELLSGNSKHAQIEAVTAIASIAESAKKCFVKYYSAFINPLKLIVTHATGPDDHTLRCRAMECIGLIGVAVGHDVFINDANEIMTMLLQSLNLAYSNTDTGTVPLHQAFMKIAEAIGTDFVPYLSKILPVVFEMCELDIDVTLQDEAEELTEDQVELKGVSAALGGMGRLVMSTACLEDKTLGVASLVAYLEHVGQGVMPWLEQITKVLTDMLSYLYDADIRAIACPSMADILRTVKEASPDAMDNVWQFIRTTMLECISKEYDVEVLMNLLSAFHDCVSIVGADALDAESLGVMPAFFTELFNDVSERRQERNEAREDQDFDEEAAEALDQDNQVEDSIASQIASVMGALLKSHKASFIPVIAELRDVLLGMLNSEIPWDRHAALCIFDDILEQTPQHAEPFFPSFAPAVLKYVSDEDPKVRQAAAFAVGTAAKFHAAALAQMFGPAAQSLAAVIQAPESRSRENQSATENAISALGKICRYAPDSVDANAILPLWITFLPVTADREESEVVYTLLCDFFEANHPALVNNQAIPKFFTILPAALNGDIVDAKVADRLKNVAKALYPKCPSEIAAALSPEQQQQLQGLIG